MTTATMELFSAASTGVRLQYPAGWDLVEKPLPDYAYPVQVFGASNVPIDRPPSRRDVWDPDANEENYPRVSALPPTAVFVWMYRFTLPDGPTKYGQYRPPLDYADSELITWPGDARWPNTVQRELGFAAGRYRYTIWVWEGLNATERTLEGLRGLVASIEV